MKVKYILVVSIGLLMGFLMIFTSVATAFSTPLFQPVIIQFGDSSQVQSTTNTLVKDYPNANVISYSNIGSIQTILTLYRTYSEIIFVGHGTKEGILSPSGQIISWKKIGGFINTLPATMVFFLSCNSETATNYVQVQSFGFSGSIDGPTGADAIAYTMYNLQGQQAQAQNVLSKLMIRINDLQNNNAKSELLGLTQSEQTYWEARVPVDIFFALVAGYIAWVLGEGGMSAIKAYAYSILAGDVGGAGLYAFLLDLYYASIGVLSLMDAIVNIVTDLFGFIGMALVTAYDAAISYLGGHCGIFNLAACTAEGILLGATVVQIAGAFYTGGSLLIAELYSVGGAILADAGEIAYEWG